MTTIDPKTAPDHIKRWLAQVRPLIDTELERQLAFTGNEDPGRLREAMRYAAMGAGKRLRPAIVLAACNAVGGREEAALPAAAALEMLHAYTLVHDDLPAMDDDVERRGRPTVHVAFGEGMAILAGDGLLTAAFAALAELGPSAAAAIKVLARRAGATELLAGQARDLVLAAEPRPLGLAELEVIHAAKTGALFAAAAEIGAIAGAAASDQRSRLARYGIVLGIAFQHADDRDDDEFSEHRQAAAQRMRELSSEAAAIAASFGDRAQPLRELAEWIGSRG